MKRLNGIIKNFTKTITNLDGLVKENTTKEKGNVVKMDKLEKTNNSLSDERIKADRIMKNLLKILDDDFENSDNEDFGVCHCGDADCDMTCDTFKEVEAKKADA